MRCQIHSNSYATRDSPGDADRPRFEMLEDRLVLSAMVGLASVPTITPKIVWSMPARFGIDTNNNGLVDLPNSKEYVNPTTGYTLKLDATTTTSTLAVKSYLWTITGNGLTSPLVSTRVKPTLTGLKLGPYNVKLQVTDQQGHVATKSSTVTLRDMLIVSLGDSYASGEGNPEQNKTSDSGALWADGVIKSMTRENKQAHRSTKCASAQLALTLEKKDPHFSVTYVQLSATGATVQNIYGKSRLGVNGVDVLPIQLTELKSIVDNRKIDLMTISGGGNDIKFDKRITQLLKHNPPVWLPPAPLRPIWVYVPETPPALHTIRDEVSALLGTVTERYKTLHAKIDTLFKVDKVLVTQYPDSTRDENGNFTTFATDYIPVLRIDPAEAKMAFESILTPLNDTVKAATTAAGWTFVGGIASAFKTHGYASSDRWFRTENEAAKLQGTEMEESGQKISMGGMHPNKTGHTQIASLLQGKLDSAFWTRFNS